ncbi:hypothetical protein MRX96_000605 [Rhipicephalus microplus]
MAVTGSKSREMRSGSDAGVLRQQTNKRPPWHHRSHARLGIPSLVPITSDVFFSHADQTPSSALFSHREEPVQRTRASVLHTKEGSAILCTPDLSATASFLERSSVFLVPKGPTLAYTRTLSPRLSTIPSTASARSPISSRVAAAVFEIPVADASFLISAAGSGCPLLRLEAFFRICIIGASPAPAGLRWLRSDSLLAWLLPPLSFRTRKSRGWPRRG